MSSTGSITLYVLIRRCSNDGQELELPCGYFYSYALAHAYSKEYIKNFAHGIYLFKIIKVKNDVGIVDDVMYHTLEHA